MKRKHQNILLQYLYGELSDIEKYNVERQLEQDPALRQELHALYDTQLTLDSALEAFAPPKDTVAQALNNSKSMPHEV